MTYPTTVGKHHLKHGDLTLRVVMYTQRIDETSLETDRAQRVDPPTSVEPFTALLAWRSCTKRASYTGEHEHPAQGRHERDGLLGHVYRNLEADGSLLVRAG